jgi:plasmid stability protein
MQSKQKITLYIPPELHRKLKIKAAVDLESMSALVEKAIAFYMQFPEQVDEIRAVAQGKTHQIHICPDCDSPMVMRNGEMVSLSARATKVEEESIPLEVANQGSSSEKPNEEELVSCL